MNVPHYCRFSISFHIPAVIKRHQHTQSQSRCQTRVLMQASGSRQDKRWSNGRSIVAACLSFRSPASAACRLAPAHTNIRSHARVHPGKAGSHQLSGAHSLTFGGRMRLPLAGAKTVGISAAPVIATTDITCKVHKFGIHPTELSFEIMHAVACSAFDLRTQQVHLPAPASCDLPFWMHARTLLHSASDARWKHAF